MRADDYVRAADKGPTVLAATGSLTVLNWGHLQEEYICGTIVGEEEALLEVESVRIADLARPVAPRRPEQGLSDHSSRCVPAMALRQSLGSA